MANEILKLKLIKTEPIELRLLENNSLDLKMGSYIGGTGEKDYEKLKNLPSINSTTLIGNYDEIDPTVPTWAKQNNKPNYNAKEVGAVDANNTIPLTSIKRMWDSVFNNGG